MQRHPRRSRVAVCLAVGCSLFLLAGCAAIEKVEGDTVTFSQSPVLAIVFGFVAAGLVLIGVFGMMNTIPFLMQKRKIRKGTRLADDPGWQAQQGLISSFVAIGIAICMAIFLIPNILGSSISLEPTQIVIRKGSIFAATQVTTIPYQTIRGVHVDERKRRGRRSLGATDRYLIIEHPHPDEFMMNPMHEAALPKLQEKLRLNPQQNGAGLEVAGWGEPGVNPVQDSWDDQKLHPALSNFPARHEPPAGISPPMAHTPFPAGQPAAQPMNPSGIGNRPFNSGLPNATIPTVPSTQPGATTNAPQEKLPPVEIPSYGRYKAGGIVAVNTSEARGLAKIVAVYQHRRILVRFQEPPEEEKEIWMLGTVLQPPAEKPPPRRRDRASRRRINSSAARRF